MDEKGEETRDLIGDQIGWSVRQILPPTSELKTLDKKIMRSLPRPIARIVALIRFNRGWLPEMGQPDKAYYEMITGFCRLYLNEFGQRHEINTLLIPTQGDPIKVQLEDFPEGQKEKSFKWDKQVEYALRIRERKGTGEIISSADLKEAETILYIQSEMTKLFEHLKPQFVKRGLPFPWLPKEFAHT